MKINILEVMMNKLYMRIGGVQGALGLKGLVCKTSLVTVFILSVFSTSYGQEMNGIKRKDYEGFESKWRFVTVRYRKDSGEMRFTYANDLAWKSLEKNQFPYPEGAVFGKVSVQTHVDESFPSSIIPSGKRRVQFMVRNTKKYKATGGWGYALFDPQGVPFSGDHIAKAQACAACHQIVKERGQVFSRPMAFAFGRKGQVLTGTDWRERVLFEKVSINKLKGSLRKQMPSGAKIVYLVKGALSVHLFSGTLDEIRPILIRKSLETNGIAVLVSKDQTQFSVVHPMTKGECGVGQLALKAFHTVPNKKHPIYKRELCEKKD